MLQLDMLRSGTPVTPSKGQRHSQKQRQTYIAGSQEASGQESAQEADTCLSLSPPH